MTVSNKLVQEIARNYRSYSKSYSIIPKPKPQKPKLKLPSAGKKYELMACLLDDKIPAYELKVIFETIFTSGSEMLIEPLEHLITLAKLTLDIDLERPRRRYQAAYDSFENANTKYTERLAVWIAEKEKIDEQYQLSQDALRTSWNKFVDQLKLDYDGKTSFNNDDIIVGKLLNDRFLTKKQDGSYTLKEKSLRKINSGYINEMMLYINQHNVKQSVNKITTKTTRKKT